MQGRSPSAAARPPLASGVLTEGMGSCSFLHMPSKPLTQFLIALCHSAELRARFNSEPAAVLSDWGLSEHPLFQPEASPPTLAQVQAAVADEFETESGVEVAWWISVPDWVWAFDAEQRPEE